MLRQCGWACSIDAQSLVRHRQGKWLVVEPCQTGLGLSRRPYTIRTESQVFEKAMVFISSSSPTWTKLPLVFVCFITCSLCLTTRTLQTISHQLTPFCGLIFPPKITCIERNMSRSHPSSNHSTQMPRYPTRHDAERVRTCQRPAKPQHAGTIRTSIRPFSQSFLKNPWSQ